MYHASGIRMRTKCFEDGSEPGLGEIRIDLEVCEEKRLSAWSMASTVGFHSYEYRINLLKRPGIVALKYSGPDRDGAVHRRAFGPTLCRFVRACVSLEEVKTQRLSLIHR
jgi:hypothetical protein